MPLGLKFLRNQQQQTTSKINSERPLFEACRNHPLFDGRQPFEVHQLFLSIIEGRTAQHYNGTKKKEAGGIPVQFRILPSGSVSRGSQSS